MNLKSNLRYIFSNMVLKNNNKVNNNIKHSYII